MFTGSRGHAWTPHCAARWHRNSSTMRMLRGANACKHRVRVSSCECIGSGKWLLSLYGRGKQWAVGRGFGRVARAEAAVAVSRIG